ncbi:MAG: hypothetical protein KGI19_09210 [Thaumarchaeota archaeon]|nr:hypothetical protein [Nitrososphaerota archaeon]
MLPQGASNSVPIYNFTTIPSWIKHTVSLQSQGLISDDQFLSVIEYLVKVKAIR